MSISLKRRSAEADWPAFRLWCDTQFSHSDGRMGVYLVFNGKTYSAEINNNPRDVLEVYDRLLITWLISSASDPNGDDYEWAADAAEVRTAATLTYIMAVVMSQDWPDKPAILTVGPGSLAALVFGFVHHMEDSPLAQVTTRVRAIGLSLEAAENEESVRILNVMVHQDAVWH